jgi:hypothetical protein
MDGVRRRPGDLPAASLDRVRLGGVSQFDGARRFFFGDMAALAAGDVPQRAKLQLRPGRG